MNEDISSIQNNKKTSERISPDIHMDQEGILEMWC